MFTRHVALLTAALAFSASMPAQCIGDDNMLVPPGAPCCTTGTPLLPPFPALQIQSQGACLLSCGVESTWAVPAFFTAPAPVFCDLFVSQLFTGPPWPSSGSLVVMKYARTWTETSSNGPRQVWRFLINTDVIFSPLGAGASPCPMPPCAQVTTTPRQVHFIGNIDYAYECNSNTWGLWFSLVHHCGYFMHGPSSQVPLAGALAHNDRSYALAGPVPFTFGAAPLPFGFLAADSQRSTDINLGLSPALWNCHSEHAIVGSLSGPGTATCPCAPTSSTSGPLWNSFGLGWSVFCTGSLVSTFSPVPLPPHLPTGLGILSLGSFSGPPGSFPGTRIVEAWIGLATSVDPCATSFSFPFHIITGTSHHGGDLGTTFINSNFTTVTTDRFFDFQNMLIPNGTVPSGLSTGIGALFGSTQVWGVCLT